MRAIQVAAGPYNAASVTRVYSAATPTSGTLLSLGANAAAIDTVPRRVIVTPVSQTNSGTLLITGTTWGGQTATETITVPPTSTAVIVSALDYISIQSILPGGGPWTANISIGTEASTTVGSSTWVRLDDYASNAAQISVTATGTVSFTVEGSDDDPNLSLPQVAPAPSAMTWICPDTTNLSAKTSSLTYELGVTNTAARQMWLRLTVNSYTGAGAATMTVVQAGGMIG